MQSSLAGETGCPVPDSPPLTVETAADAAREYIDRIDDYPDRHDGRGIVICAGGIRYLTCAWVLIHMLRRLGCELPIEVWYLGEDEGDADWIELVRPLGVTCVDAHVVRRQHPHPRLTGWESKAFAIQHSRFEEVLFLDADNVPVVDPTFLFDDPNYRETGAVFWPDGPHMRPDNAAWQAFDVAYRDEREVESGQLLIDKRRCWRSLNLCNWYNEHSDFFYQFIYGDKDTFRFAWHRLGQSFSMPRDMESIPFTICQHDFQGRRIFQHRCHDKWLLSHNHRAAGFEHESECLALIDQLRKCWDPVRHLTRHLQDDDCRDMDTLVGLRFRYERIGQVSWPLELGANGRVSVGWTPSECYWWCKQQQLVLADQDGRTYARLDRDEETWAGHAIKQRSQNVRMAPLASHPTAPEATQSVA